MRKAVCVLALVLAPLLAAAAARAGEPHAAVDRLPIAVLCQMLETRARQHGLPGVFFVRLIWRESAFDPHAISHKGAQGIAQFMPATAAERGLADPFDPAAAVAHSAAFLSDLTAEFGNVGLAAAAYNAGPQRVRNWLAGNSGLPLETRNFVRFITGRTADEWQQEETGLLQSLVEEAEPLRAWCMSLPVRGPSPPPAVVASAPRQPWGVQLAANFNRDRALAASNRVRQRHASVLSGHEPTVVRARSRARGSAALHAVRIGAASRSEADALCRRLRADGGACMVTRN